MTRFIPAMAVLLLLVVVAPAQAFVREIGLPTDLPFATASCPSTPCQAIGQVTGYQMQLGKTRNPFVVHRPGSIVAFTIRLGQPNQQQTQFFNNLFGGPPQARVSLLKTLPHNREAVLEAQSEVFNLAPYLGSTPTFALSRPLKVQASWVVALTVPTWAPAFAIGLPSNQNWRAARPKSACNSQKPATHQTVGSTRVYQCLFRTARLLYSATFIPTPSPTTTTKTHH